MSVESANSSIRTIKRIRTLGPPGTNCEAAAEHYIKTHELTADVVLHDTLEEAMSDVIRERETALLGCAVYPDLHNLVFPYLSEMSIAEVFMFNTFNMVLATRLGHRKFNLVASHPAPQALVKNEYEVTLSTSNVAAAKRCIDGEVDACVTTLRAAQDFGMDVMEDYGKVPMGFSVHVHNRP